MIISRLYMKPPKKTAELGVAGEKLSRDRSEWRVEEAEKEAKAEKLREQMESAKGKRRIQLANEYKAVVNEIYDERKRQLTEELRIQEGQNKLTTNSLEDIDKVNQLKASLIKLDTDREKELGAIDKAAAFRLRKRE